MEKITCLLPYDNMSQTLQNIRMLQQQPEVGPILLLGSGEEAMPYDGVTVVASHGRIQSVVWKELERLITTRYVMIYTSCAQLQLGYNIGQRVMGVLESTDATMLYSDYEKEEKGMKAVIALNDCGPSFLRDDFDFGPMQFYRADELKKALKTLPENLSYASLYAIRLQLSLEKAFIHLPECLYTCCYLPDRGEESSLFDYVDPANRQRQVELENLFSDYLKVKNAWLPDEKVEITDFSGDYPVEASVVIPVKNRVQTVADAVRSALNQQTNFKFNVIVIDNYSTDGTSELLHLWAGDTRMVLLRPDRTDLGIGGCWNYAINSEHCGRFAIQLDSDDLYSSDTVLQTIVDAFYRLKTPMIVGSYQMTDFDLNPIPPGIIDHREWSDANGHNNLLRVHGIGAPRAFYTSIIRQIGFPNVSYGEDYAVALRISRDYRIGRIYEVLYNCRRWENNSDAKLTPEKARHYHHYKDCLRLLELEARRQKKLH